MASATKVKTYLAHWFQLGKKLIWRDGTELLPTKIIEGDRYSKEFEECWQKIISINGKGCHLEGNTVTIEELLTSAWSIDDCAVCSMPVPLVKVGIQPLDCVCSDLDNWPNSDLPAPRSPVNNRMQLNNINARLKTKAEKHR
ncbi:hypothetical protein IQ255_23600 [Pleurocapsales cyanobacterium LEGE 10410]|nr:hypothetical protein [Pleurocapsales cyanobacterium LEGE 10410]